MVDHASPTLMARGYGDSSVGVGVGLALRLRVPIRTPVAMAPISSNTPPATSITRLMVSSDAPALPDIGIRMARTTSTTPTRRYQPADGRLGCVIAAPSTHDRCPMLRLGVVRCRRAVHRHLADIGGRITGIRGRRPRGRGAGAGLRW